MPQVQEPEIHHGHIRDLFKTVALGIQYGQGYKSLALQMNIPEYEAKELVDHHRRLFRHFWTWKDEIKNLATLKKEMTTIFGFKLFLIDQKPNLRSIMNFPMQSTCAEMMRLAACYLIDNGIKVLAPIHDAFLIEAVEEKIDATVATTQKIMSLAAKKVLGGFDVRTDVKIIRYPEHYRDPRGDEIWRHVNHFLEEMAKEETMVAVGRGDRFGTTWREGVTELTPLSTLITL